MRKWQRTWTRIVVEGTKFYFSVLTINFSKQFCNISGNFFQHSLIVLPYIAFVRGCPSIAHRLAALEEKIRDPSGIANLDCLLDTVTGKRDSTFFFLSLQWAIFLFNHFRPEDDSPSAQTFYILSHSLSFALSLSLQLLWPTVIMSQ